MSHDWMAALVRLLQGKGILYDVPNESSEREGDDDTDS